MNKQPKLPIHPLIGKENIKTKHNNNNNKKREKKISYIIRKKKQKMILV